MITQEIKQNINKIDFDLKELFENVRIKENSQGNRYFFEISASTKVPVLEKNGSQNCEVKVIINKFDLLNQNIKWKYSVNPINESSDWIDRISNIEKLASDCYEIVSKKKMDPNYFNKLEVIVEKTNKISSKNIDIKDSIKNILINYKISDTDISEETFVSEGLQVSPDKTFVVRHSSDIKISDKFKIEREINLLPKVKGMLFKPGYMEIYL